jgi:hypothetical protein
MSKNTFQVRLPESVLRSGYEAVARPVRYALGRVELYLALSREEAILRSINKRLLEDIGYEPIPQTDFRPDHASHNEFTKLAEIFGLTRFQK